MTDSSTPRLNRRDILAGGGAAAAATFLATHAASAGPAVHTHADAPAQDAQEVRLLIRDDIKSAYAAEAAVDLWSQDHPAKITLDVPPAGADVSQKIQAAQASGDLVWDGMSVIEFPSQTSEWVNRKLMVPLDDLIAASTIAEAKDVIAGIIPSIAESLKYEGKQYAVPGNVGSVALAWMTEPLQTAGITEDPVSWQEVHDAAAAIYENAPDYTPFDSAGTPLCDLWSLIWGATDKPLAADTGYVDITGQASIDALNWMKQMVDEELMPPTRSPQGSATNQQWQDWQKGATAIITCFDVAATINQQTFGIDAAKNGLNIRKDRDQVMAGTPFWTNGSVVLNGAKNPQGMADFLLWWFSPANEATGKQITQVAAKPCYQYTYDSFVKDNPEYQWEADAIEVVRNSVPFPADNTRTIQQKAIQPWMEQAIAGEVDPEEAMANALADIQKEVDKLKN
jgi:ABC-type glycerol-3-phosphate transport system substrate-binding protein